MSKTAIRATCYECKDERIESNYRKIRFNKEKKYFFKILQNTSNHPTLVNYLKFNGLIKINLSLLS